MKLSNHSFDVAVKLNENSLKMILEMEKGQWFGIQGKFFKDSGKMDFRMAMELFIFLKIISKHL